MSDTDPAWVAHQRARWLRPDWQRFVRHDAHRFAPPNPDEQKSFAARRLDQRRAEEEEAARDAELKTLHATHLALRRELAELKFELAWRRLCRKYGYNPDQPRDEQGRWTDTGGGSDGIRLAGGDRPRLGRAGLAVVAGQVARKLIEAFRSEKGLWDLFGQRDGTVALTTIDGKNIFGSNSTSPTYTSADRAAAIKMRDTLLAGYPDVMDVDDIGRRPNNALFHAESNVLLRAAGESGGSLAGRTMDVFVDNPMCWSCSEMLPLVGMELGNPMVTFHAPNGVQRTMQNGKWMK